MANRGLYGQAEGNEKRCQLENFTDHLRENEIAEGEWLDRMVAAAVKGDLAKMARLRDEMKLQAINGGADPVMAQERADTVLRQAMGKLRI